MARSDPRRQMFCQAGHDAAKRWLQSTSEVLARALAELDFKYGDTLNDINQSVPKSSCPDHSWGFYDEVRSHYDPLAQVNFDRAIRDYHARTGTWPDIHAEGTVSGKTWREIKRYLDRGSRESLHKRVMRITAAYAASLDLDGDD